MIDKNDIRDLLLKECDICLHLYTKLPKGALEYRPSPDQRNTLELLRYLTFAGTSGVHAMLENNWDYYQAAEKRAATLRAEEFPKAMETQKRELAELFERLTPQQFDTQDSKLPTGETMKLGQALMNAPARWMTAYRMQLFIYAKAAGNKDLWTPNCWAGMDMARPTKK